MAYLFLVMTVMFWAGNFILARALHTEFEPITLAFYRWSLALLILLPFWLPKAVKNKSVLKRYWLRLTLLGVTSVAGFNTFLYVGLQTTTVINASLMQSMIPVIILLVSAVALKERVRIGQWLGVVISLIGVLLIILQGDLQRLQRLDLNIGDLWVLGAVIIWALYSIALRWLPKEVDGFLFLGFAVSVAVLVLFPLSLWEMSGLPVLEWTQPMISTVIYMAICPSILSYLFWNRGVAELGAPKAGLFIHLLPMFGMLLSSIFLDEEMFTFHWVGIVLIFTGIYLAVVSKTLSRIQKQQES